MSSAYKTKKTITSKKATILYKCCKQNRSKHGTLQYSKIYILKNSINFIFGSIITYTLYKNNLSTSGKIYFHPFFKFNFFLIVVVAVSNAEQKKYYLKLTEKLAIILTFFNKILKPFCERLLATGTSQLSIRSSVNYQNF